MKVTQIFSSLAITVVMLEAAAISAQFKPQEPILETQVQVAQIIPEQIGIRSEPPPPNIIETAEVTSDIAILFEAGNRAQEFGNYAEAEALWRQVLERSPKNADAYSKLGDALSAQKQLAAATDAYRQAIQLNPNLADAYTGLGFALLGQGQFEAAQSAFDQASDIHHRQAEAHDNLGRMLQSQGRLEEARREYQLAIQLDPSYEAAQEHLDEVEQLMKWQ